VARGRRRAPRKGKPPEPPLESGQPLETAETETPRGPTDAYKKWSYRVAQARRARDGWERVYHVEKCEKYVIGQQEEKQKTINIFGATLRTMKPNLFFSMPKFYVRPKPGRTSASAVPNAAIGEGMLEAIAEQDAHLEIAGELAVLQAFARIGVLKIVYDPAMVPNPKAGEPIYATDENGEPHVDQVGEPIQLRHPLTGVPITEPDEVLSAEVYRWAWVDATNMLLPDEGPDPRQWTWIGEEITVPLEEAKEDSRFNREVRKTLKANRHQEFKATRPVDRQLVESTDEELFCYYECYDLKASKWYVWADEQDAQRFLVDDDTPSWIDQHPYAVLSMGLPIIGPEPSPWPYPVTRDWLYPQDEYNIRRRQMQEGAKRSARKGVYFEGSFDDPDEAVKLLQSPDDMQFAKVLDPKLIPLMIDTHDLNPAIYKDIMVSQADWRTITGQTGARLADPESDTATEASFVERAANLRESDLQRIITRWMSEAGRKMLQCVRETLTIDRWIKFRALDDQEFQSYLQRIYGVAPEMLAAVPSVRDAVRQRIGSEKWVRVTREDLQFEADVTVAPGSTRPKNLEFERRQWLEFLKILGAAPQLALSPELLRYTADKFEGIPERVIEELSMLAKQMVDINANQAGRNQGATGQQPGGAAPAGTNGTAAPSILAAITGGVR
jgi:hypothetical protein